MNLIFGGMVPFTTIDFPGRLAAVLFLKGCQWRCVYCHNPDLWRSDAGPVLPFEDIRQFLERRRGFLEGIVVSGGEPTEQASLPEFLKLLKDMGYAVGLHTNGSRPRTLEACLRHCDWVGMDVKAPLSRYAALTGVKDSHVPIAESIRLILTSGVSYECRTTFHPLYHNQADLEEMALDLEALGVKHYVVQLFHGEGCANERLGRTLGRAAFPQEMSDQLSRHFESFAVRS